MRKNHIDSVPPELIAEFFRHAAGHGSWFVHYGKVDSFLRWSAGETFPPWTYTYVSKRWKDIALGNGDLWANVQVRWMDMSPARLELQLQRARSFPLRVSFQGWGHRWPSDEETKIENDEMMKMLELLVGASSRWEQVALQLRPEHLFQLLPAHNNVSRLKSVEINVMGPSDPQFVGLGPFAIAPALKYASLKSNPAMSRNVMQLPFRTLTSFEGGWTVEFHTNVLGEATALENLHLHGASTGTLGDVNVVCLPRLSFLAIHSMAILHALRLPALTALQMAYPDTAGPLISLVRRSNAVLKGIRIEGVTWGTLAAASEMLDAIPEISTLGIALLSSSTAQKDFLRALTVGEAGGKQIGPNLRTLHVTTRDDLEDHRLVVALAASRWRQPEVGGNCACPTRMFVSAYMSMLSVTSLGSLAALRSEGLEVDLYEHEPSSSRYPFPADLPEEQLWWAHWGDGAARHVPALL